MQAYNIAATHRLEPISGFDEITHLQFTAPLDSTTAKFDNGTGEEFGLPSGSVVSINENGDFIAGAAGTAMPCFLLWNTSGADGMAWTSTTANGMNYAGTAGVSAAKAYDSRDWLENSLDANGSYVAGGASPLQRNPGESWSGTSVSYSLKPGVGNFTAWPATCGLELTSTEFERVSTSADDEIAVPAEFKRNDLLTSPVAGQIAAADTDNPFVARQKARGGFLKVDDITTADLATNGIHNICGTVSRGIMQNENAIHVLFFWAERTLVPTIAGN